MQSEQSQQQQQQQQPKQPVHQQDEDRVHFPDITNQSYVSGGTHDTPIRPEAVSSVSMDKGHIGGDRVSNTSSSRHVPQHGMILGSTQGGGGAGSATGAGGAMRSASLTRPLQRNLADAKKARRKIEDEAQLLANRIALLKQEEVKTWKKIEETRKRANEVKTLKRKNEDRVSSKLYQLQNQQDHILRTQNNIKKMRQMRENQKIQVQRAIHRAKTDQARHAKMIRQQNESRKKEQLKQIEEENTLRSQIIREQLKHQQMRKQEAKMKKLQNFRKSYEKRVNQVEQNIGTKQQEVIQMEILEMQLIKKLQNTQAIQKSAYMELQDALAQPSPFYVNAKKHGFSSPGQTKRMVSQGYKSGETFPPQPPQN